jgi:hypothetical protein
LSKFECFRQKIRIDKNIPVPPPARSRLSFGNSPFKILEVDVGSKEYGGAGEGFAQIFAAPL